jgi:hypothetical protein
MISATHTVLSANSKNNKMNSMTYEPMFMLAILPMAAMGAAASLISDDAARWINGASKDIMDVQNEVEDRSRLVDIDCFEDRFTVNDRLIDTEVREYLKTTGFCIFITS